MIEKDSRCYEGCFGYMNKCYDSFEEAVFTACLLSVSNSEVYYVTNYARPSKIVYYNVLFETPVTGKIDFEKLSKKRRRYGWTETQKAIKRGINTELIVMYIEKGGIPMKTQQARLTFSGK